MSSAVDRSSPSDQSFSQEPSSTVRPSFAQRLIGAVSGAIFVVIVVFAVSSIADYFLLKEHEPARLTIEISDAISSIVIGLLCFQLFRLQQQRRQQIRQRLEVIADMNHHVRNALQVISFTTESGDEKEIKAIRESVNRIQWALKELLPKI